MKKDISSVASLLNNYLGTGFLSFHLEIIQNQKARYEYAIRIKSDNSTYLVDLEDNYVEEHKFDIWPPI